MSISVSSQRVASAALYQNGSTDQIEEIKKIKSSRLLNSEKHSDGLFDYFVPDFLRDYFAKKGVHTSVHSFQAHPHPCSKMIENHILYNIVSQYVDEATLFVSCKESKLRTLFMKKTNKPLNTVTQYNRLVHAKDVLRYTNPIRELDMEHLDKLSELSKRAKTAFIHDEVHYWSLKDFQSFLGHLGGTERLLYSIIYPAELHIGCEQSLFPEAYEFDLLGEYITWYPDGKADGSYKQPVNPWLLTTSKTEDVHGQTWTLTKVLTMGAHHLFLATKGSTLTEEEYHYDDYTVILPKKLLQGRRRTKMPYLRSRFITSVLLYLMALKKPDPSSAVAKLRQLTNGEESTAEALFVAQLSRQIQETKLYDKMGNFSLKECIWSAVASAMGDSLVYFFDKSRFYNESLERFILDCAPAKLQVNRVFRGAVYRNCRVSPHLASFDGATDEVIDELYLQNIRDQDRDREPYQATGAEIPDKREVCRLSLIEMGRLVLKYHQEQQKDINLEVVISPLDNFNALRNALTCRNGIVATTCLLLTWEYNPLKRYEMGLIGAKELNDALFGESRVEVMESKTKPATVECQTCACGLQLPLKKLKCEVDVPTHEFKDVLKGRKAAFYSRHSLSYNYNGGSHASKGWPEWLDEIATALGLDESYDHCLAQMYDAQGGINFHADDESCYTNPTVVTVNLNGNAHFRVKCKDEVTIELKHGDVLTMPAGFQSTHKHAVTSLSDGRVSLTFRNGVNAPDEGSDKMSEYEENAPELEESLDALEKNRKSLCALQILADHMRVDLAICTSMVFAKDPRAIEEVKRGGMTLGTFICVLKSLNLGAYIESERGCLKVNGAYKELSCYAEEDHVSEWTGPRKDTSFTNALLMNPDIRVVKYEVCEQRAKKLADSFQEGFTGVCLNKFQKQKSSFNLVNDKEMIDVHLTLGFAGSGKSFYPQCVLKNAHYSNTLVIVPRKALCSDWINKVHPDVKVVTFESAFRQQKKGYGLIVIDEIGLLPPGYIDMVHGYFAYECLLVLGDPLQCEYHSKGDHFFLGQESSVFKRFKGHCNYLYKSHRLPKNQRFFEIECDGADGEGLSFNKPRGKDLTLCASQRRKESEKDVSTVGESQGLSANRVNILLDKDWSLVNEETVIVALTRARKEVNIIGDNTLISNLKRSAKSMVLRQVLKGERVPESMILSLIRKKLPDCDLVKKEMLLGASDEMEEKLTGDPYLKGLLCLVDEIEEEEVEIPEPELLEPQRTHLPLSVEENELSISDLRAKEYREASTEAGKTDQIDELGYKGEPENPMSHKALYLYHQNSDVATFFLSVRKRLRFRDAEKNRRKYNRCRGFGAQMFQVLKGTYKLRQPDHLPSLERAEQEFMKKRIAKSAKLIEKHSYRSEPDWPSNYLKIFLKQQRCTKMEKRKVDAKAGQTIACFCHAVLCRFGPLLRQTEKALRDQLGPNVMIYSQKNYTDLDKWCKNFVRSIDGTDSDYEAFDRSQDEKILDFEVNVLRFFLWPEEMIEEYVTLKLMMGCSMGSLAVMRFSGEFGTFFFNTICNMGFTCLKYSIRSDTPICYAGDDMYAPGVLVTKSDYKHVLDELQLKAKVNYTRSPLFCGWRMSPYGIVKDPNLLLDRWKIAERDGSLKNCMVNYALEAIYGYRLGEHLFDLNIDIDAQQDLVRRIVLIKHQLPQSLQRYYSDEERECYSDGEEFSLKVKNEGGLDPAEFESDAF
uniref:Replicase n=1 Tax=Grapevine virus B TaxID=35289 RepID=A0A890CMX5_9VIRU|nr:replicase [Grapevine virus B]